MDGRKQTSVNYALVRVVPPPDVEINPKLRPFIVVDPRAGHGPGIGGFKADIQGRPPMLFRRISSGSHAATIKDIGRAEAFFIGTVSAAHPPQAEALVTRKLPGRLGDLCSRLCGRNCSAQSLLRASAHSHMAGCGVSQIPEALRRPRHRARQRHRSRKVRRRGAGAEL